jgi:hypothetical protein
MEKEVCHYFEWWFFGPRRVRNVGQAFRLSPKNRWRAEAKNFSEKSHASQGQAEGLSYAPCSPGHKRGFLDIENSDEPSPKAKVGFQPRRGGRGGNGGVLLFQAAGKGASYKISIASP